MFKSKLQKNTSVNCNLSEMCKENDGFKASREHISPMTVTSIECESEYDIGAGFDDFGLDLERIKPVQDQVKSSRQTLPHEIDPTLIITLMLAMKKQAIADRNAHHIKKNRSGKFFSDHSAIKNMKVDARVALSFSLYGTIF